MFQWWFQRTLILNFHTYQMALLIFIWGNHVFGFLKCLISFPCECWGEVCGYTLTPCFSPLKKIVNDRLDWSSLKLIFLRNVTIFDFQYGFMPSHSTADILTVESNRITRAFNGWWGYSHWKLWSVKNKAEGSCKTLMSKQPLKAEMKISLLRYQWYNYRRWPQKIAGGTVSRTKMVSEESGSKIISTMVQRKDFINERVKGVSKGLNDL